MAIRLEFVCFALPNVGEIISFILKRLMYIYIIRTRLSVGLQIAQPWTNFYLNNLLSTFLKLRHSAGNKWMKRNGKLKRPQVVGSFKINYYNLCSYFTL